MKRSVKIFLFAFVVMGLPRVYGQDKQFKLIEVDRSGNRVHLSDEAGRSVGMDSAVAHFYEAREGLLTMQIPAVYYNSGKIKLRFLNGDFGYVFWTSQDGSIDLSLRADDIQEVLFIRKEDNPFTQLALLKTKLDSLSVIGSLYEKNIKEVNDYALLSNADKLKYESKFSESLVRNYLHDPKLRSYSPLLTTYFENRELIRQWQELNRDFEDIRLTKEHHAFYEALFLNRQRQVIEQFITLALAKNTAVKISRDEQRDLLHLHRFLLSPDAASTDDHFDLKVFYRVFSRYVDNKLSIRDVTEPEMTSSVENISNLNVEPDLPGSFISGRREAELNTALVLKQAFKPDGMDLLYPNTYQLLHNLTRTDTVSAQWLKSAVKKDINEFPFHYHDWLKARAKKTNSLLWLQYDNLCKVYQDPTLAVSKAVVPKLKGDKDNGYMHLLSLMSYHLRDHNNTSVYISSDNLNQLDGNGQKYFIYLLYQYAPQLFQVLDAIDNHPGFAEAQHALHGMLNKNSG